jgi:putative spermidine/putrescine transport system permease protein
VVDSKYTLKPNLTEQLSRWHTLRLALSEAASILLFRGPWALLVKLLLPLALVIGLFALPLIYVLRISFWTLEGVRLVPDFTLANYVYFLSEPVYQQAILRTVHLGLTVSVICFILGYPLALILVWARLHYRSALTFILVTPLFVSVVIRAFGWLVLFEHQGLINSVLIQLGIIQSPIRMINNLFSVSIAEVNVDLVFMVLPIVVVLAGIPKSYFEAARTLGASPFRAWWHVIWPLSAPGVLAGFVIVFALAVSSYVQPSVLGGGRFNVVATQIYRQVLGSLNWPLGAAMGYLLLAVSALVTSAAMGIYWLLFPHTRRR